MNDQKITRIITLNDLFRIFLQRFWIMLIVAVLVGGGLYTANRITFEPRYESTATLYILRQNEEVSTSTVSADFTLALNVVNDCTYLLKSHAVVDQVIDELGIDISYSELYRNISTSNPENTRILEVTVENEDPYLAKKIVDKLCEIGAKNIEEAMGFNQVNLYEYGILERVPCNRTGKSVFALSGLVAALLVYSIYLVIYFCDDRIRTEDDIERLLGLSILGDIPNADGTKKNKYRYRYYAPYGRRKYQVTDTEKGE